MVVGIEISWVDSPLHLQKRLIILACLFETPRYTCLLKDIGLESLYTLHLDRTEYLCLCKTLNVLSKSYTDSRILCKNDHYIFWIGGEPMFSSTSFSLNLWVLLLLFLWLSLFSLSPSCSKLVLLSLSIYHYPLFLSLSFST